MSCVVCLAAGIGLIESYVASFNAADTETVTNAFPNSEAVRFMTENVPRFECSDSAIEKTYYFRWWTLRKHLRRNDFGWTVSEFLPNVGYAGPGNTIVCPAGHHLRELRWLRDSRYAEDYAWFWFGDKGTKRIAYGTWLATAVRDVADVTGNDRLPTELLDGMVANYREWERQRTAMSYPSRKPFPFGGDGHGLFLTTDDREGTELSLSGDGYRPLFNSAMYGEARAIADTARAAGRLGLARTFDALAERTAGRIRSELWNRRERFFVCLATNGVQSAVCELHGYAPWYFGIPLSTECNVAWTRIVDRKRGFRAKYGLTFPTRDTPGFTLDYTGHACKWNGPVWPFATSVALTALANALRGETPMPVGNDDYVSLLHDYAAAQRLVRPDGTTICWIDENQNPDTGEWIARKIRGNDYGKDYNHSTFCDLVISGLCGIVPHADGRIDIRPLIPEEWHYCALEGVRYHGKMLNVYWDRDGTRYGYGKGLTVTCDGKVVRLDDWNSWGLVRARGEGNML